MPAVNERPLEEPERDDDELTEWNDYAPYFMDRDAWHPYEEHDELGSG